ALCHDRQHTPVAVSPSSQTSPSSGETMPSPQPKKSACALGPLNADTAIAAISVAPMVANFPNLYITAWPLLSTRDHGGFVRVIGRGAPRGGAGVSQDL